ncbi:serine/threonine protein kinase [Mesobacillus harenae]|uniref:serine/threonine protein kinase n=1 Tax=Mesobacillus harenae TaxID=2213203 RepID=UPI001F5552AA|nr:protein kinase [Mesobacillus harenae]
MIDGRYLIEEYLGCGSYGRSYLVFDQVKGRRAVLKMLRLHKRLSRKSTEHFRQESYWLTELDHPALPCFYERGTFKKAPFFTMEYVNGKTFEQLIFEEGMVFSEKTAFKTAIKLNDIIGYLHSKNLVHRDIRIPNVMVEGPELKLIDFGLARRLGSNKSNKKVKNPFREQSVRSDFYGLGHFLLFLLYSSYEPETDQEQTWEEELTLTLDARRIIRKLLQIDEPYDDWRDIQKDFMRVTV